MARENTTMPGAGHQFHAAGAGASANQNAGAGKIRVLGTIEPASRLICIARRATFPLGTFNFGVEAPKAFVDLLASHGLRPDRSIDEPTLIASTGSVEKHQDWQTTAVWVLVGAELDDKGPVLTVGDQAITLRSGEVLLFDAWTPHSLHHPYPGELWVLLSTYVQPVAV